MLLTVILIGVVAWIALAALAIALSSAASRADATKDVASRATYE